MAHDGLHILGEASMKKKTLTAFLFIVLASAGCVSTEELAGPVSVQAPVPQDVRTALIRAAPMQPGALKNVTDLNDAPALLARELRDALAPGHPAWRVALADAQGAEPDADLVIATELLEIDGGSAAMRFWIGFGAGAIVSRAKVSMLDRAGRVLAASEISQRTTCPTGGCGDENEALVRENLKLLAASAAGFVGNPAEYQKAKGSGR
jgi:hypothetical protein